MDASDPTHAICLSMLCVRLCLSRGCVWLLWGLVMAPWAAGICIAYLDSVPSRSFVSFELEAIGLDIVKLWRLTEA